MRNELLLNYKMLKDNYNEVRSLCDSYIKEIEELQKEIDALNNLIDSKTCLT